MSGFNPDVPLEVNDHQVVEALVAQARKWITQRNESRANEASAQAEQGEPARSIQPSSPGQLKGPIVSGPLRPIFLFDLEVERGPGYGRFDRALLQWNSVVIDAGHFRVDFPRRFESELTDLVAGGANSEQSFPFITYHCDLAGFSTFCQAPGVISYFAFGRWIGIPTIVHEYSAGAEAATVLVERHFAIELAYQELHLPRPVIPTTVPTRRPLVGQGATHKHDLQAQKHQGHADLDLWRLQLKVAKSQYACLWKRTHKGKLIGPASPAGARCQEKHTVRNDQASAPAAVHGWALPIMSAHLDVSKIFDSSKFNSPKAAQLAGRLASGASRTFFRSWRACRRQDAEQ
jgi:hypothetical protein